MSIKNLHYIKRAFRETDVICIIDKNAKILYYNNYNDIHNKLGTEKVVGRPFLEVYPWLDWETSTALKVLKTGEAIVNQAQVMKLSDGTEVNAVNTAFPLKNKNGILGVVFLSYDINTMINTSEVEAVKKSENNIGSKYKFSDIITKNAEVMRIIAQLKKAAKYNSNILIYGETGTGKELFVHSIHNASNRVSKPFISQNCAAIPENLMESLFFGTTKGSFTGSEAKKGLFELANGGTIFLDEINSMPPSLQAKLLRVIENGRVRRIGGKKEYETDVRIIASTNEKLEDLLGSKRFRKDLYYRISVVNIEIPPLRKRKDDIQVLCDHFILDYNEKFDKDIRGIDTRVEKVFLSYDWPGNVREFKNCIESAFISNTKGNKIRIDDIPKYILKRIGSALAYKEDEVKFGENLSLKANVQNLEEKLISKVLEKADQNITKAAEILKISRQSLYHKLKKYNLNY
ncbi:Arginine utilization regulatory protein RocR [Halanaerobium saccharolyticum subsp. saccharolyticum DSM 6643]|uniref:Arginine utilization regulatory protein RocR n=1 Tax=Halanaerobium saccharolyticum subsp. saccharolyticum DSM 6643 TaxID=1293054 RepID=M5E095_9FIRM|nr:sigma 54-interacting transcriptional regulator [Halanaerobium saccharolyticum]CCU78966.1 Arginine utilization regulatory protein RocR [Halanaerobium saccharolyticum subsp. saccharolyticum DSM 6643]